MKSSLLVGAVGLAGFALADPTWPSTVDELEEIIFQLNSFRARKFADTVNPCSNEASGPGRQNAAEWLRIGFHDMSTTNTYFGTGGLDASIQYELDDGENTGPGHKTTLEFMSPFFSPRSSLADLIAAGVYTSVRSCGGPVIPVRAGRIDAVTKGDPGVPQPQNSVFTFKQQFDRMGFTNEEMIQVTACGHTLGGVHSQEFPDLVPAGTGKNGEVGLDSSFAVFDNKVVTEYLSGKTQNPLVVGPSVKIAKNSDFKVFNSDNNVTMKAMKDAANFKKICQTVLAKMINTVPPGVTLTDPIVPYMVKPVSLQLSLANGGTSLQFSGYIRVKTTTLSKNKIKNVVITYLNRDGKAECGGGSCAITTTLQGVTTGFDDSFAWFPIEASIPASTGISSFTVTINQVDGTSTAYDNNGKRYPLQDAIMFQTPQSCVLGSSGAFTAVAAVRNDRVAQGAKALVYYKVAQAGSPVPQIKNTTIDLTQGDCVGKYTLFKADYTIEGGNANEGFVDVINGDQSDSFKKLTGVGGSCQAFPNPAACDGGKAKAARRNGMTTLKRRQADPPTTTPPTTTPPTTVPPTTVPPTTTTIRAVPTHRALVGGYQMVSCYTEGNGTRALGGATFYNETMTLEKCEDFCKSYVYWGTEYGRECYCGNSLGRGAIAAPIADCNIACGGDGSEFCGAGNRLELYSTTVARSTTTPTPTGTLAHKPTIAPYTMVGCWAEGTTRALGQAATASATMTNEECATFCKDFKYFGTEYGSECYCGSFLDSSSSTAPLEACNMVCAGNEFEFCGASNRLELYMNPNITGGPPQQPPVAGNFVLLGCQTEGNGTRALPDAVTTAPKMTNEVCADFCKDYNYFGTEYGSECYCGNALAASSLVKPAAECQMLCGGNSSEYCGASNRLSVYNKKPPVKGQ